MNSSFFPKPEDVHPHKPIQDIVNVLRDKLLSCEFVIPVEYGWNSYATDIAAILEKSNWKLSIDKSKNTWNLTPLR